MSTQGHYWYSIASSTDGVKLAAVDYFGSIFTSADSGVTWTEQTNAGSRNWQAVASSASGAKLVAVDGNPGFIYTSTDSGATWTERTAAGSRNWAAVASSADGSRLVAGAYGGPLFTSSDSGATWTEQTSAGSRNWQAIASSANGAKIIAATDGGYIYLGAVEGPATRNVDLASLADNANGATEGVVRNATITATSDTCYVFDQPSIKTLSPIGITVQNATVKLLGGIAYNLNCTANGGAADVEIALDAHYSDLSQLHAYKKIGGSLQDITSTVTFANKDVNGTTKTVLSYNLTDGASFDEDATANGTIVDSIYFGVASSDSLASTGTDVAAVVSVATALVTIGAIILGVRTRYVR